MSDPLFSVVIPCFNVAGTVEETLASVLGQTEQDFEILAVDNNCTDRTGEILGKVARIEPRLRIVRQPVQGLSAARNAGIGSARGRHVALIDADDLWDRDYLETHAAHLDHARADVSFARVRLIDWGGRATGQATRPKLAGLMPADLLRSNPCTAMIVVRREVFHRVGMFDESLRRVEDQEWLFRMLAAGFVLAGIDRVLASYRISPGGLSADLEAMLASHGQMLEAAARVAPDLVARHRRLAHGGMLRYCARRALDHAKGGDAARGYLLRMLGAAPDLLVREPLPTLKVMAAVLLPHLAGRLERRRGALRTGEV